MTQEEVMQTLTDMGLHEGGMANWVADNAWWRLSNVVAQHEREACAKVCDGMEEKAETHGTECCKWPTPSDCAYLIRARGQA